MDDSKKLIFIEWLTHMNNNLDIYAILYSLSLSMRVCRINVPFITSFFVLPFIDDINVPVSW